MSVDSSPAGAPLQINTFCAGTYSKAEATSVMTCIKVITGRYVTVQKMRQGLATNWAWTLVEIKIVGSIKEKE